MSLRKLLLARINEHRKAGNLDRARRLEDALQYLDGVKSCTPR